MRNYAENSIKIHAPGKHLIARACYGWQYPTLLTNNETNATNATNNTSITNTTSATSRTSAVHFKKIYQDSAVSPAHEKRCALELQHLLRVPPIPEGHDTLVTQDVFWGTIVVPPTLEAPYHSSILQTRSTSDVPDKYLIVGTHYGQ